MRQSVLAVCCLLLLVAAAPVSAGDDHSFLDMENCAFCSSLVEDPSLLMNLGWENHNIADGMVSITTFNTPEAEASYATARKKMEATGAKMMAGEEMDICGFCQSMTGLMMEGATHEEVEFEGGVVMLLTSTNPETVEHIHTHCGKINEEMKKMEAHHMEG